MHSTQNSIWHIVGATYLLTIILPVLLVLISHLKVSSHCGQHKRYTLKSGLRYQRKAKGKVHSLNLLSKVEKLDSLGHGNRSSHDYIMEENALG